MSNILSEESNSPPTPEPLAVDVVEAGRLMGVGRSTVLHMIDAGILPVVRFGRRISVRVETIGKVLAEIEAGALVVPSFPREDRSAKAVSEGSKALQMAPSGPHAEQMSNKSPQAAPKGRGGRRPGAGRPRKGEQPGSVA